MKNMCKSKIYQKSVIVMKSVTFCCNAKTGAEAEAEPEEEADTRKITWRAHDFELFCRAQRTK